MKQLSENYRIATEQEMIDAGLWNFPISEDAPLMLWQYHYNDIYKQWNWIIVREMRTSSIPCHINSIYEIDGSTYYIREFRPQCLEEFYKGEEDHQIIRGNIHVFLEKNGGITLRPKGRDWDYKQLASISAEFGCPMTPEAFEHNYSAWKIDRKSEFVEDTYAVFTPCGCNSLYFWIEKRTGDPNQITYMA